MRDGRRFRTGAQRAAEQGSPSAAPRRGGGDPAMPGAGAWLEGVLERWDSRRRGAEGPAGPSRLLPEMSPGKLFGLLLLLVTAVSILASSFVSVEYYQFGLRKTKSTGRVEKGRVYGPGRYAHGPDSTFKRFPADYHLEEVSA